MDQREGDMAEKCLARQPQQDGGILADAPEHGEILKFVESLAENVDALVLQLGKVIHSMSASAPVAEGHRLRVSFWSNHLKTS